MTLCCLPRLLRVPRRGRRGLLQRGRRLPLVVAARAQWIVPGLVLFADCTSVRVCFVCVLAGVEAEGEGGQERKDTKGGVAAELHQG